MMRRAVAALLVLLFAGGVWAVCAVAAAKRHRRLTHHHKTAKTHRRITKPTWLNGVSITEYYAVPEAWFSGQRVVAPGLPDRHRVDWLYSAAGLAVEGDGIDLMGRPAHVDHVGGGGYVDARGRRTSSAPTWLSGGYWLSDAHALTFPLEAGGWSAGVGVSYLHPPAKLTFAPGPSRKLTPYRSLAVDPALIPLGSRVYIPAYVGVPGASGWFVAEDTGGAILGRHVDVYRPAPQTRDGARSLNSQRILVEPPGTSLAPASGGTAVPVATVSCAPSPHLEAACPKS